MSEVKRVVILGQIGSGKTSLYNLITQQQESTQCGGWADTYRVTIGFDYFNSFEVIDTPGFSQNETIASLAGIFVGLYYGHINRILLVVKQDRVENMMQYIKKIIKRIKQIKQIITIVVSHWDGWNRNYPEKDQTYEQKLIKYQIKFQFDIDSVLFISNDKEQRHDKQNLQDTCNQIEQILLQNDQPLSFKANGEILEKLSSFDKILEKQLEQASLKIQNNFKLEILEPFQKYLDNFNFSQPNVSNILHQLQLDFKKEAEKLLEKFIEKYGEQMNNEFEVNQKNVQYFQYIYLKQKITNDYQSFLQKVQDKMIEKNLELYSWIRRCPNCKLIWVKVSGCDGKVYCGQLSNSFDLVQQNQMVDYVQKYQFVIRNNQLSLEELIVQTDQFNPINLIKQFVIEITQQKKFELSNFKEKTILLKEQYKKLMQQREEHKNNIFYNFNELSELYREIIEHYCIILENKINNDRDHLDNCSKSLSLISEEDPPIYVQNCSFLNLNLDEWLDQINYSNQGECLHIIKQILSKKEPQKIDQIQINYSFLLGCKKKFVWADQPKLSKQELQTLYSQDVLDYLSDPNKFIADEENKLKKELKTFNISLNEGMKNIKILQNIQ